MIEGKALIKSDLDGQQEGDLAAAANPVGKSFRKRVAGSDLTS
jgi:hypothetical protein